MPGQTQSEIRSLLTAANLAPRYRYGQNFLVDLNLMRKLLSAAELQPADVVLEVGCGTGSLTELLLEIGVRVVGVEIDHGFQAILRERLGANPRFTLIQGDALAGKHQLNPFITQILTEQTPLADGRYKLVANLPYQIATPLLMELLYCGLPFERLTCTIQKEVGERLAAEPGEEGYGPVSILTQTLGTIELLAVLPPTVFWPRPQVESIMLTVYPRSRTRVEVDDVSGFVRFVHAGFAQRRKMLRGILRSFKPLEIQRAFDLAKVSSHARPEELSPAQWRVLFRELRPERRL